LPVVGPWEQPNRAPDLRMFAVAQTGPRELARLVWRRMLRQTLPVCHRPSLGLCV